MLKTLSLLTCIFLICTTSFSQTNGFSDSLFSVDANLQFVPQHNLIVNKTGRLDNLPEGSGVGIVSHGTSFISKMYAPLFVVNGFPLRHIITSEFDFTTADKSDYARLIGLPQDDISEIRFLTDAVSKLQYGLGAEGGIIYIVTKRGQQGKPHVDYSFRQTMAHQPKGYDLLNGGQYISLIQDAIWNTISSTGSNSSSLLDFLFNSNVIFPDPNTSDYYNYGQNTDWVDAVTRMGSTSEHHIALSGGGNKVGYRLSTGYIDHTETTVGSDYSHFNARLSLDYRILKNLKTSIEMEVGQSKDITPDTESIYTDAIFKMPNMSIYRWNESGNRTNDFFMPQDDFQGTKNPVAVVNITHRKAKSNTISPVFRLAYRPFRIFAYDFMGRYFETRHDNETKGYPLRFYDAQVVPYSFENTTINQFYFWNRINIDPINTHNHKVSARASLVSARNTLKSVRDEVIRGYPPSFGSSVSLNSKSKLSYYLYNFNYMAFNRYGVTLSFRDKAGTDYLPSFSKIQPSAGLNWLISGEPFLQSLTFINKLNLGFVYGENESAFPWGVNHINKEIRLSGIMFKENIEVNIGYHKHQIKNILPNYYLGYYISNRETVMMAEKNDRIELGLRTNVLKKDDLSISMSLLVHRHLCEVRGFDERSDRFYETSNGSYLYDRTRNRRTGDIYGYRHLGVYSDYNATQAVDENGAYILDIEGESIPMVFYPGRTEEYEFQPGDAMYADINKDGAINDADIVKLGNTNPLFSGSLAPVIRYKNWDLVMFFNFRYGNDIVNVARMNLENMYGFSNQSTAVLERWRQPGDVSNMPRALYRHGYNWLGSNRFVEDGSFLRLKAITLKYEFPQHLANRIKLNRASCFITARNVFTWTNYSGADPEVWLYNNWRHDDADTNYRPAVKEFTFGLFIGI